MVGLESLAKARGGALCAGRAPRSVPRREFFERVGVWPPPPRPLSARSSVPESTQSCTPIESLGEMNHACSQPLDHQRMHMAPMASRQRRPQLYEARLVCEWMGGRLPTADEWQVSFSFSGQSEWLADRDEGGLRCQRLYDDMTYAFGADASFGTNRPPNRRLVPHPL